MMWFDKWRRRRLLGVAAAAFVPPLASGGPSTRIFVYRKGRKVEAGHDVRAALESALEDFLAAASGTLRIAVTADRIDRIRRGNAVECVYGAPVSLKCGRWHGRIASFLVPFGGALPDGVVLYDGVVRATAAEAESAQAPEGYQPTNVLRNPAGTQALEKSLAAAGFGF
jgi:hypothetical protein